MPPSPRWSRTTWSRTCPRSANPSSTTPEPSPTSTVGRSGTARLPPSPPPRSTTTRMPVRWQPVWARSWWSRSMGPIPPTRSSEGPQPPPGAAYGLTRPELHLPQSPPPRGALSRLRRPRGMQVPVQEHRVVRGLDAVHVGQVPGNRPDPALPVVGQEESQVPVLGPVFITVVVHAPKPKWPAKIALEPLNESARITPIDHIGRGGGGRGSYMGVATRWGELYSRSLAAQPDTYGHSYAVPMQAMTHADNSLLPAKREKPLLHKGFSVGGAVQ
jgi:hypothetical protein